MSGISYDLKKIKGFIFDVDGVLSPSVIQIGENGEPIRMANTKDGYALQLAIKHNYKIAIITGCTQQSVKNRYNALGIKDVYLGAANKITILKKWLDENSLIPDEVIYMGDDIPDLKCMRQVELSCAPYDACHEAREIAKYISPYSGGYGCVRDVIEQAMRAQGNWMKDDNALHW